MKNKRYSIVAVLILMFVSCNDIDNTVRHLMGKTISFEWEKETYCFNTTFLSQQPTNYLRIIAYAEEDACDSCLINYLNAASMMIKSLNTDNVFFILVTPIPIKKLESIIEEQKLSNICFIQDKKQQYLIKNNLTRYTYNYRTFLIDKKDKIVCVGDPLRSRSIYMLYRHRIQKILKLQ